MHYHDNNQIQYQKLILTHNICNIMSDYNVPNNKMGYTMYFGYVI